jgi:hypothetical protein
MRSNVDWGVWLGAGGIVAAFSGTVINVIKARPESRKLKVDAAKVLTDIALGMTKDLEEDVQRLGQRLAGAEKAMWRTEALMREHMKWDHKAAKALQDHGLDIGDPPPLYDSQSSTGAQ